MHTQKNIQAPLIISLKINDDAQKYFNALRKANFPAHINWLDAHLTLFHKLPASEKPVIHALSAMRERKAFLMQVNEIKNMGKGVAYGISSPALQQLHKELQDIFNAFLIRQDRQILWPHITVQNKVTAFKAKKLSDKLVADFSPFNITAKGLSTWLYRKGPREHKEDFLFQP